MDVQKAKCLLLKVYTLHRELGQVIEELAGELSNHPSEITADTCPSITRPAHMKPKKRLRYAKTG